MQAGESVCEMRVRATTDATPAVPEHTLVVVQRAIAGVDTVDNERPTAAAAVDETDAELRARAKVACRSPTRARRRRSATVCSPCRMFVTWSWRSSRTACPASSTSP